MYVPYFNIIINVTKQIKKKRFKTYKEHNLFTYKPSLKSVDGNLVWCFNVDLPISLSVFFYPISIK